MGIEGVILRSWPQSQDPTVVLPSAASLAMIITGWSPPMVSFRLTSHTAPSQEWIGVRHILEGRQTTINVRRVAANMKLARPLWDKRGDRGNVIFPSAQTMC